MATGRKIGLPLIRKRLCQGICFPTRCESKETETYLDYYTCFGESPFLVAVFEGEDCRLINTIKYSSMITI